MILNDGSVKIMDFGIARVLSANRNPDHAAGNIIGNGRLYGAGTVLGGRDRSPSDIFAYGVIFTN
jgi:serine/threonine protein kinase